MWRNFRQFLSIWLKLYITFLTVCTLLCCCGRRRSSDCTASSSWTTSSRTAPPSRLSSGCSWTLTWSPGSRSLTRYTVPVNIPYQVHGTSQYTLLGTLYQSISLTRYTVPVNIPYQVHGTSQYPLPGTRYQSISLTRYTVPVNILKPIRRCVDIFVRKIFFFEKLLKILKIIIKTGIFYCFVKKIL